MNLIKSVNGKLLLPYSIQNFVLGAGSNVIIRDGGFNGITIKLTGNFLKLHFIKKKLGDGGFNKRFNYFKILMNKILFWI